MSRRTSHASFAWIVVVESLEALNLMDFLLRLRTVPQPLIFFQYYGCAHVQGAECLLGAGLKPPSSLEVSESHSESSDRPWMRKMRFWSMPYGTFKMACILST